MVTVSTVFRCRSLQLIGGPTTPAGRCHSAGLGSSAFARHYLRNHYYFLFLRVMRCFSSPRSPPLRIPTCVGGLPHSDIRGSMGICPSPRLFAAYHVLLRLREPQASPMRPSSFSFYFRLCARRSLRFDSSLVTLASDSICCQIVSLAFPSCQCPLVS